MDEKLIGSGSHRFSINNRSQATLTGVKDVISFDAAKINLDTIQGRLTIKGGQLHVSKLSLEKGEVDIDGRIDCIEYSDDVNQAKQAGSVFGRLFK